MIATKQIFAAPALWAFIAAITAFMYPVLGLPLLAICAACLYWATRAAYMDTRYTYLLGGILLAGVGAGVAFMMLACIMLAEHFFHVPRARSYLAAPVGLLYFTVWFCILRYREKQADWQDFQITRKNRFLSANDGNVVWSGQNGNRRSTLISLAIGGGIALMTVVGAFVGKENAQATLVGIGLIGSPVLALGYGMRVIIGFTELRKLEKTGGERFPLPDLDGVRKARAASWIGRLINAESRAIHRGAKATDGLSPARVATRARK